MASIKPPVAAVQPCAMSVAVDITECVPDCSWSERSFLLSFEGHCSWVSVESHHTTTTAAAVAIAVRNLDSYLDLQTLMDFSSLSSRCFKYSRSNSIQLGRKSPAMTENC